MLKKRTILSFYQCASCRTLAIELVRQNANSTYLSKQSGHKEPSWPSGIRAAGLIWNTLSAKSWLTLITNVRLLYHTSAVILLWCINFRFNNYSIHDNAWHCIQYQYRWWWCSRVKCKPITFGAAHPSLRWAPPVMYGHFCLVPRVSVHDRYYCTEFYCRSRLRWWLTVVGHVIFSGSVLSCLQYITHVD